MFFCRVYFVYDARKIEAGPNVGKYRVCAYPMFLITAWIKSWIYGKLLNAKEELKKTSTKPPEATSSPPGSPEYKLWETSCLEWIDNWTKDYQRIVGPWSHRLFWGMKEVKNVSAVMAEVHSGDILRKRPNQILPKLVLKKCGRDTTIQTQGTKPMRNNRLKRKQVVKR